MKNWIYLGAWAAAFGGLFYMMSNDSSESLLNDVINASTEVAKVVPIKDTSWKPLYDPTINWETNYKSIDELDTIHTVNIEKYYTREKTLAEQVFNYTLQGDVNGSTSAAHIYAPSNVYIIIQEREKCVVYVLSIGINGSDQGHFKMGIINQERHDVTQINPKDWLHKTNDEFNGRDWFNALYIGGNKKLMLHPNVERQRLENGWVKLFEQCPYKGPKSAF